MAQRIMDMRGLLRQHLEELGSQHNWQHITDQVRACSAGSRLWRSCRGSRQVGSPSAQRDAATVLLSAMFLPCFASKVCR